MSMNYNDQNPNMTDTFPEESLKKDKTTLAAKLKNAALKIASVSFSANAKRFW